jgi:hypothetical protein
MVVRSIEQSPGSGYYRMFHPETGDDPVRQHEAWDRELERMKSATYPSSLQQKPVDEPTRPADIHQKSRLLGSLHIADNTRKPSVIFTGNVTCPQCSKSFEIEIQRNSKAVLPRQPAFVIVEAGAAPNVNPLGHLFVGTILTSTVLYFGGINHCGSNQWISLFFNRALRDRSDHHLTIMQSTSEQPG